MLYHHYNLYSLGHVLKTQFKILCTFLYIDFVNLHEQFFVFLYIILLFIII